ncbi:unnamed protein product [marine sediment metagenome]|uniref:Uncharacterized protein n=1 Tax=marine sediment metagenome TaxID=412755 RepID=X1FA44_9ZZZZ
MPKAIICIGNACEEIIQLSDGTTIHQPKPTCDTKHIPEKDFLEKYLEIADKSTRTVRLKTQLFKGVKVGTDIPLDFSEATEEKTPEVPAEPPSIDEPSMREEDMVREKE